ncbi:hypothetical protein V6N13_097659 [Hibiscus sabdariffa]|uniref:Uncharacterized protein n=2 Tax=Hibiscus sabdariffa TaxID=183260 RepID=A0ABR2A8N0_9ROSI
MVDVENETVLEKRVGKDDCAVIEQSIENLNGLLGEKEKSGSINLISVPIIDGENVNKFRIEAESQKSDMGLQNCSWAAVVSEDIKNQRENGVGLNQK